MFKKILTPGAKLTEEELHLCLRYALRAALGMFLLVVLLAIVLIHWGGRSAAAYQGADFLTRSGLAWGTWIQAILAGWLTYEVLDSSKLGKWLLHWADGESLIVRAAKTLGAALLLAGIVLAASNVFGRVLG